METRRACRPHRLEPASRRRMKMNTDRNLKALTIGILGACALGQFTSSADAAPLCSRNARKVRRAPSSSPKAATAPSASGAATRGPSSAPSLSRAPRSAGPSASPSTPAASSWRRSARGTRSYACGTSISPRSRTSRWIRAASPRSCATAHATTRGSSRRGGCGCVRGRRRRLRPGEGCGHVRC